jgi:hypothetical protein
MPGTDIKEFYSAVMSFDIPSRELKSSVIMGKIPVILIL